MVQRTRELFEMRQVPIYFGAVAVAVAVAVALALLAPGTAAFDAAINPALAFILFVTFLQVPLADLGRAFTRWRFMAPCSPQTSWRSRSSWRRYRSSCGRSANSAGCAPGAAYALHRLCRDLRASRPRRRQAATGGHTGAAAPDGAAADLSGSPPRRRRGQARAGRSFPSRLPLAYRCSARELAGLVQLWADRAASGVRAASVSAFSRCRRRRSSCSWWWPPSCRS